MPYYHCRKCQHEFERIPYKGEIIKCDWCGADKPRILEDETPLEKLCKPGVVEKILKEVNDEMLRRRKRNNPNSK